MKIRTGFVSNSSSSSFIIGFKNELTNQEKLDWLKSTIPAAFLKRGHFWYETEFIFEDFNKSEKDYRKELKYYEECLEKKVVPINLESIFDAEGFTELNKDNFDSYKEYVKNNILNQTYWSKNDIDRLTKKYIEPTFDQFFSLVYSGIVNHTDSLKHIVSIMDKYGYNVVYELCLSDAGDGINVGILKDSGEIKDLREIEPNLKLDFHKRILKRWC